MKSIIMKVHKHNGSTRVTIPKEIIKALGWEESKYLVFHNHGNKIISLSTTADTLERIRSAILNHGHLQTTET